MTPRFTSVSEALKSASEDRIATRQTANRLDRICGPYDALGFPGRVQHIPLEKAMSQPLPAEAGGPDVSVDAVVMTQLANAVCWATHVWTTGAKPFLVNSTDAPPYPWAAPDWHRVAAQLSALAPALKPGPMLQLVAHGPLANSATCDNAMFLHVRAATANPRWLRTYHGTNEHAAAHLANADVFMKATLHFRGLCSVWVCDLGLRHDTTSHGTPAIKLQSLQRWRTKLLNNMRSRAAFRSMRGLFWQLGYSPSKGHYLSIIAVTQGDEVFARQQREEFVHYWTSAITSGHGTAFYPNPQVVNRLPSVFEVQDRCAASRRFLVQSYFSYLLTSPEFVQPNLPEGTHRLAWKLGGPAA